VNIKNIKYIQQEIAKTKYISVVLFLNKNTYFCIMKNIIISLSILLLLSVLSIEAFAQGCVTCTNTAAQLGQDSAIGLNKGIIYLVIMPITIVIGFGIYFYRRHKHSQDEDYIAEA